MKLSKCANGHFYDSDKYPECPYCNTDLLKDHAIVHEGEAEPPAAAAQAAAPAGPVTGWLVVLDGPARGRDLRLGIGRSFLGLDDAGAPITLSTDAPLSARQAVVVYDAEKNSFVLLPGLLAGALLPRGGGGPCTQPADRRRNAPPRRCGAYLCAALRRRIPLVRGQRHDK